MKENIKIICLIVITACAIAIAAFSCVMALPVNDIAILYSIYSLKALVVLCVLSDFVVKKHVRFK